MRLNCNCRIKNCEAFTERLLNYYKQYRLQVGRRLTNSISALFAFFCCVYYRIGKSFAGTEGNITRFDFPLLWFTFTCGYYYKLYKPFELRETARVQSQHQKRFTLNFGMRGWIPKTGNPTCILIQDLLVERVDPTVRIVRNLYTPNSILITVVGVATHFVF